MPEAVLFALQGLARTVEIIGRGALVLGFVLATLRWFGQLAQEGVRPASEPYRQSLGRTVLVGLEVLVAATVMKTITLDQTAQGMGILVAMIAIRTALGWTMVLEMTGRWPWGSKKA